MPFSIEMFQSMAERGGAYRLLLRVNVLSENPIFVRRDLPLILVGG